MRCGILSLWLWLLSLVAIANAGCGCSKGSGSNCLVTGSATPGRKCTCEKNYVGPRGDYVCTSSDVALPNTHWVPPKPVGCGCDKNCKVTGATTQDKECKCRRHYIGPRGDSICTSSTISSFPTCNNPNVAQGSVKLLNGPNPLEGNVFIWETTTQSYGTVCDDYWDNVDASVVCKSLGYEGGVATKYSKYGHEHMDHFVMDDVKCKGSESNLSICPHLDSHNCRSNEVAGVKCNTGSLISSCGCNNNCKVTGSATPGRKCRCQKNYVGPRGDSVCSSSDVSCNNCRTPEIAPGSVKLEGSQNKLEGNVYVWETATKSYGTVCDDHWDDVDASVVCKSLGYEGGVATKYSKYGHEHMDHFVMDDVKCKGSESNLSICPHLDSHNCRSNEVAGVQCYFEGSVKLSNGPNSAEGNIYVWDTTSQSYGTVCDDYWDNVDASVACESLGYDGGVATHVSKYGQVDRDKFVMDDVHCSGAESDLSRCEHKNTHNCWSNEVAGAKCYNEMKGSRWIMYMNLKHGKSLTLKHLTLPGTHHSGLVESLSPWHIIKHIGVTQHLTPTQQFESGVRVFDLRFTWSSDNGLHLCHGNSDDWYVPSTVKGMKWEDFLQESVNFLNANPSEFFVFGLSWEDGSSNWPAVMKTLLHTCVQPLIYIHSGSTDDIMNTPVCNLQGKILIRTDQKDDLYCKMHEADIPSHFPNYIWKGSWYNTNTADPSQIYGKLIDYTNKVNTDDSRLYDIGAQCTPDLKNLNVKKLDVKCKTGIQSFLNQKATARKANVIGIDFATPELVKKIFMLNKEKTIPASTDSCVIRKPGPNPPTLCSVNEPCQCF